LVPVILAALFVLEPSQIPGGSKERDKQKDKQREAPAKSAAPKLQPWVGKFEDANPVAKARNVPILVHVILESEETNDEYRDKILPDAELLKRSESALVLVVNNGTHPRKTIEVVVDGEKSSREVCSAYPMFAQCSGHQTAWDEIFTLFHDESGELKCPQTIVLLPDGTPSGRINTSSTPQPDEISALLVAAVTAAGPGLTSDQFAAVKRGLEVGRRAASEKQWIAAWLAWSSVLAITQAGPYAEEARPGQAAALAGMRAELDRIVAGLVPGTAAKSYEALTTFATQAAGTPLEKVAQQELKQAEKNKAIRDELKAWRLSVEADALFREANGLTDEGDTKQAERVVRKLLTPRYAGTPAQDAARKQWPKIAKEVDGK
jgi:hypothetical protein